MPTFEYQLVEKVYHNRITYEDDPGSLRNIVADCRESVCATWINKDEAFGERLIENGSRFCRRDSSDGWVEYSYWLMRRPQGANQAEWEFVGVVFRPDEPDYDPEWY
jgi:hypothetical protein